MPRLQQDPRSAAVLADTDAYRLQIRVSVVTDGPMGPTRATQVVPFFRTSYFYPASAIKLCGAIAALEQLNRINEASGEPRFGLDTPMTFHPLFDDEVLEDEDPSNLDGGTITVGHEIRKLFLVSDNRAFNRMYEFASYDGVHESMWRVGLDTTRCLHRLSEFRTTEEQRRTPKVSLHEAGFEAHTGPAEGDVGLSSAHLSGLLVGDAHVVDGTLVDEPMDFTTKNSISIDDLQTCLVLLVRPDLVKNNAGFRITEEQRQLCLDAMSRYPGDSENPAYGRDQYPDDYVKFLLPGILERWPQERVTIFNKVGRAYGFSTENAYIVDEWTGRSLFVTATLYTNPNGVVNDGDYGYEEIADPFFEALGEVIALYLEWLDEVEARG